MPFSWRRPFTATTDDDDPNPDHGPPPGLDTVDSAEVTDGSLKYTREKGGNDSLPSYQEASGAPVESHSPLGYSVGPITIIFLNVSKMIGTGVYSTRELHLISSFEVVLCCVRACVLMGGRVCSVDYSQGDWFGWAIDGVLGAGVLDVDCELVGVSGIYGVFSESVGV